MITEEDKIRTLTEIQALGLPVGASFLHNKLHLSQATIGRILTECEGAGFLEKVSNKGRILTSSGHDFLQRHKLRESKMESADRLIAFVEEADRNRLIEVLEVRKILEAKTAAGCCIHGTDAEIADLDNILLEYLYAANRGELPHDQDLRFHLTIASMSRNNTIHNILNLILTSNNEYQKFSLLSNSMEKIQVRWHVSIVDAIRERDPDKAAKAMVEHMNNILAAVKSVADLDSCKPYSGMQNVYSQS